VLKSSIIILKCAETKRNRRILLKLHTIPQAGLNKTAHCTAGPWWTLYEVWRVETSAKLFVNTVFHCLFYLSTNVGQ
jgi:hypothetical protein